MSKFCIVFYFEKKNYDNQKWMGEHITSRIGKD